ncbi:hypothetical protein KOW79_020834 [Hemibagrus wyckioides]|uniref:Uncharacterized protein n=1 Tax=Hemibagrus wyckioides TaxID=337641 RepID=A0A9D3N405_9TELE|nr:hypothetical protein KOW79_020834 [Hemibagrus wyckioides]
MALHLHFLISSNGSAGWDSTRSDLFTIYRCFRYVTGAEAHPVGLSHAAPVKDEETKERDAVLYFHGNCFIDTQNPGVRYKRLGE